MRMVPLLLLCSSVCVADRPNLLLVTVDDMNCDSVGVFGCELEGTTPQVDAFAKQAMRFEFAHVQVGNCFPSRNVMWSGRYPHNSGVEGFYQVKDAKHPHLADLMKQAGYFVGIRGKVSHSTPYQPYAWDADLTILDGEKQYTKDIDSYYRSTAKGIAMAKEAGKPFCLNINISDPHKPFYAMGKKGDVVDDPHVPSRIFTADEVPIPGFLFDHPGVRKELAHYYSSVRRADDCFGATMKALEESGQQENTVVVFLSDHGMPLPFAKTAMWHHSTRTPLIVHWPNVTKPNSIDKTHMVSAVDFMPTLLDIIGEEHPEGFDGRSFAAALKGQELSGRDTVYKVYNENSGGNRSPMRCVQSKKFGYHFNPWSDGQRVFKTATTGTITYRTMVKLAADDPQLEARLNHFHHNTLEEFYDYQNDPDALVNLINNPDYTDEINQLREAMKGFMQESNDPVLEVFNRRNDAAFVSDWVNQQQAESDVRRASRRKSQAKGKQNPRLFRMDVPESTTLGGQLEVTVRHRLPDGLGSQEFHVTLKDGKGKRIERIVKSASGTGKLVVTFTVPKGLQSTKIQVAAFVGADYQHNLMHRTEGPVKVLSP